MEKLKHFTAAQQLDRPLFEQLCERANRLRQLERTQTLAGRVLVLEFYEPSTRTRHSFEAAMNRMGGSCTSTENATEFSSAAKGETYEDTIRVIDGYGDAVVVRTKETGVVDRMAALSRVPVINAGDGAGGQHPTQALLDFYTIWRELHRIEKLNVALVGDLSHGRTARSVAYLLGKCGLDINFVFISPPGFEMDQGVKDFLDRHSIPYREERDLDTVLEAGGIDVVYMTRVQRERMSEEEYSRAKGKLVFTEKSLAILHREDPDAILMHPLPKVDEVRLPIEVEQKDRAIAYFRQAENGLWIRMALLEYMLGPV